jgi:hypothetical protein
MKRLSLLLVVASAGLAGRAAAIDTTKLPPAADKKGLSYAKDIHPILEASCIRCHGAERPKAGLRLDSLEAVLKGGKDGKVVIPGDSVKSQLLIAVSQLDPELTMPPKPRGGRQRGGQGGQGGQPEANAPHPDGSGGQNPPGGPGGPGGLGGPGGPGGGRQMGPPPKPLTPEQVGLVRAWIEQGAK